MIWVDRRQVDIPHCLDGPDSPGGRETKRAIEFFSQDGNENESFLFEVYRDKSIRYALNVLFNGKCAYCESKYIGTQPMDVEHYRPKNAIRNEDGIQKPGYYWLATKWENLLPSCIDCNRRRGQEFDDGGCGLAGKGSLFPIEDCQTRAREPEQEHNEIPLLLNPCEDYPEEHIEFFEDGSVRARLRDDGPSEKGKASIEIYGLHRIGLIQMRRDHGLDVLVQIIRVIKFIKRLDENVGNTGIRDDLVFELTQLYRLMDTSRAYSGMTYQLVKKYLPFVAQHNRSILGVTGNGCEGE